MHAVIATGGKQYRVKSGDRLKVESLIAEPGSEIEFDKVLLVGEGGDVTVGKPYVPGGKVLATVRGHGRGKKIRIVKFRRRKGYLRHQGHRQDYTELVVTGIEPGRAAGG